MSQHTLTLLRFTYKKLKEKLTVSDSKKLFHEKFPYVIPGLYKRIVDEMLVELNLLNHQNDFTQDYLFCVGLTETFKELMKGYKPEKHLEVLFNSLCSSTNFEAEKIKDVDFSFEGPFGTFDRNQLQRGLQVYTEVCAGCHGMKQVAFRTLGDPGGPELELWSSWIT